ncbi:DUF1640 domain-containing protein [Methylocucumis oryzae]|uniref:DUF1640 domain-containing protein n=1 Tax=Methylocucumis oryzae TaxID=1632867 RepID=A0A0F3IEU7_9GAMM|nr:DUF1640 domain-containing protein [Methylocucumis oryzae]KJV05197.1 hypothetical protein VZ94_19970 [Methylocucumis oryzae]
MTTITFDTLQLVDKLKAAGIPQEQAEAVVRTIAEAQTQLVTKTDLDIALAPLKTDLAVLKWMMGVMLAGIVSLVLKTFF